MQTADLMAVQKADSTADLKVRYWAESWALAMVASLVGDLVVKLVLHLAAGKATPSAERWADAREHRLADLLGSLTAAPSDCSLAAL